MRILLVASVLLTPVGFGGQDCRVLSSKPSSVLRRAGLSWVQELQAWNLLSPTPALRKPL